MVRVELDNGTRGTMAPVVADINVAMAIEGYGRYLADKGNKPGPTKDTLYCLNQFFPDTAVPQDLLFGHHWWDWPRHWVRTICEAAGVPVVSAHAMRGLHSTLAMDAGVTGAVVAASLGHESISTTMQSYAKPEAIASAKQQRTLTVLDGGKPHRIRTTPATLEPPDTAAHGP